MSHISSVEERPLLDSSSTHRPTLKEHLQQTLQHNQALSSKNQKTPMPHDDDDEKTSNNNNTTTFSNDNNNNSGESQTSNSNDDNNNNSEVTYRDFFTEYGTQRVTIEGDISSGRPVIITYHDIGVNHVACYQSFFSIVSTYANLLRYFVIVHIDAPGHHYDTNDSDSKKKGINLKDNKDNLNNECKIDSFELSKLASFIETIIYELKITRFFGFGVGAGCNVWLEYSRQNNTKNFDNNILKGLILINPTNEDASWSEWGVQQMFSFLGSKKQWLNSIFFGSMIPRYTGWQPLSEESNEFLLSEINKVDEDSALKYFRGYINRKALTSSQLKKINCRCLILASEESKVFGKTLELQSELSNNLVDFVKFDHGSFLMTESHPQQLIKPIELFVQGLGVSELTMEMKFGKITD